MIERVATLLWDAIDVLNLCNVHGINKNLSKVVRHQGAGDIVYVVDTTYILEVSATRNVICVVSGLHWDVADCLVHFHPCHNTVYAIEI